MNQTHDPYGARFGECLCPKCRRPIEPDEPEEPEPDHALEWGGLNYP